LVDRDMGSVAAASAILAAQPVSRVDLGPA
jgi:hypothetical protein